MNTALKVIETQDGKFVGQVYRINTTDHTAKGLYETPEYITREMAYADANCWDKFHGGNMVKREYTIDYGDTVRTLQSDGGKPRRVWTGPEFTKWLTGAQAKFPQMTFRVGTEFDLRKTTGEDFFLIVKVTPDHRERCFIVNKG